MDALGYYKLFFFIAGLTLFTALGVFFPFRKSTVFKKRWFVNIFFSLLNTMCIVLIASGFGLLTDIPFFEANYGIMSHFSWIWPIKFVIGFLVLDVFIYWQHRVFHKVPLFWKLHRLHHSDIDFDASTGIRFHPFEAILSFCNRLLVVYIFGISLMTLVVFEIVLNLASLFNHSNFAFPSNIEKIVRKIVITPELHRIHHSVDYKDSNTNFGFSIVLWDHLFRSFKPKSPLSFKESNIGVLGFQSEEDQKLSALVLQPLEE